MKTIVAALAATAALGGATVAEAGVIIQPKSVTVNIGGELTGFSAINMINQSGLSTKYKNGVTDFDTYVGLNPIHSHTAGEWLSSGPISTARVTFDLGEVVEFNGVSFWNEDSSSLQIMIASIPFGGGYTSFPGSIDHVSSVGKAYGPTVARHQLIKSRYVTFDIYGCNRSGFAHNGCGLGEVAFRSTMEAPTAAIPEPGTWALMILGFGGVGATLRRRQARVAA